MFERLGMMSLGESKMWRRQKVEVRCLHFTEGASALRLLNLRVGADFHCLLQCREAVRLRCAADATVQNAKRILAVKCQHASAVGLHNVRTEAGCAYRYRSSTAMRAQDATQRQKFFPCRGTSMHSILFHF